MNNEKYAVYERKPAHGSTKNGMILGPFNSKEEAQSNGEKYGYTGDNYYVNSVNNEKMNQIIDEAYGNYLKHNDEVDNYWIKKNPEIKSRWKPYSQEEFINKCKTDAEFSERWGLKIEERELSDEERYNWYIQTHNKNLIRSSNMFDMNDVLNYNKCPTKLITVTYNNETIEIYDN